jgi:hypothetical protein
MTEENWETYYNIAADVLVKEGVAELNLNYDSAKPYSEMLTITHPERIFSFDETGMELDCTTGGKRKSDRNVRDGVSDRGECMVTKQSSTTTATCGRNGIGEALPPYIVFRKRTPWLKNAMAIA